MGDSTSYEKPIIVLIVIKGGLCVFSKYFGRKDKNLQEQLIAGLVTALNDLGKDAFDIDSNMKQLQYNTLTVIFHEAENEDFQFVYAFKGDSSNAKAKLSTFYSKIKSLETIWKKLVNFNNSGVPIPKDDVYFLQLISEKIFRTELITEDAEQVGLKRIFFCRRDNEEFDKVLWEQIRNSDTVFMLGNSFRDFFSGNKSKFYEEVSLALENGTKFKILLLDPLSEAAKERSIIENTDVVKDDDVFKKGPLFLDIRGVVEWMYNRDSDKGEIKTKFSSLTPGVYMIRTREYTFVEHYHIGKLGDIPTKRNEHCIGGYVPVLMSDNNSRFAKLLFSHFNNAWEQAKGFPETAKDLQFFLVHPKQFRLRQFISSTMDKMPEFLEEETRQTLPFDVIRRK